MNATGSSVSNPPPGWPRIVPHLIYDDVNAAVEWLTDAFGFSERKSARHINPDGRIGRTQMHVGDSLITVGEPSVHGESPRRCSSTMLYVYVDAVERHYQHTLSAGANVELELDERPWGDRTYQVLDPEGHRWVFAQHVFDANHAACGEEHVD